MVPLSLSRLRESSSLLLKSNTSFMAQAVRGKGVGVAGVGELWGVETVVIVVVVGLMVVVGVVVREALFLSFGVGCGICHSVAISGVFGA